MHWGTALSDGCSTLSVGCRAPSAAELAARIAEQMATSVSEKANRRYEDPDLVDYDEDESAGGGGGRLKPATIISAARHPSLSFVIKNRLKRLVLEAVEEVFDDDSMWDGIVGGLVTEPKRYVNSYDEVNRKISDDDDSNEVLERVLNGGGALYRAGGLSFASSVVTAEDGSKIINRLFVDGEKFEVVHPNVDDHTETATAAIAFQCIERGEPVTGELISPGASPQLLQLLKEWINGGLLYFIESEEET